MFWFTGFFMLFVGNSDFLAHSEMKQFLQHQQVMWETFGNLTSTTCWSALLVLLFPAACDAQFLLWSVVWPIRNHQKGCLSVSLEKSLWQQRADSARDRQKGCLAKGRNMEEPCWLQSWVLIVWGESFSNFIYYLNGSDHCRKERRQRGWLGNESRREEMRK